MKKQNAFILSLAISIALLLALTLVAVACTPAQNANTPTPSPTASVSSPGETPTPVSNMTPVAGAVTVHIALAEFTITSSIKTFHTGVPYYFVVTNRGRDIHEFKIILDNPNGTPLSPALQYTHTLFELEPILPGTTWTFNYTFSPSAPGRYEMACQMRNHYQAGMRLPIVVLA